MKSCAQALGIDMPIQSTKAPIESNALKQRQEVKEENKKDKEIAELKQIIKDMTIQMDMIAAVISEVCKNAFGSNIQNEAVMTKINEIRKIRKPEVSEINENEKDKKENEPEKQHHEKRRENANKGKRKNENTEQLMWKESDNSGINPDYVNCVVQCENRRVSKNTQSNE